MNLILFRNNGFGKTMRIIWTVQMIRCFNYAITEKRYLENKYLSKPSDRDKAGPWISGWVGTTGTRTVSAFPLHWTEINK